MLSWVDKKKNGRNDKNIITILWSQISLIWTYKLFCYQFFQIVKISTLRLYKTFLMLSSTEYEISIANKT